MGRVIGLAVLLFFMAIPLPSGHGQQGQPSKEEGRGEPQSADVFPRAPSPRFLQSGERRVIEIVLKNPGKEIDFYTLSIERRPQGWMARVDPVHVDLPGQEEATIQITLIPRRGPPSFTEQMTQYDVVVKAEDKSAKAFYSTLSVYLKPGRSDLFTFFGTPAVIGFGAIWMGGWLRRRKQFRVGGLFVMGGGILAVVSITAVLGILTL